MDKYEAGYTYTDAELLALYREALAAISVGGQQYRIDDRWFTSADLPEVRDMITWLEQRINEANASSSLPANFVARMVRG